MNESEDGSEPDVPPTRNLSFSPLLVKNFGSCFFNFGPNYAFTRNAESFYTLAWTPNHLKTILVPGCHYSTHKVENGRNLVNQASIRRTLLNLTQTSAVRTFPYLILLQKRLARLSE